LGRREQTGSSGTKEGNGGWITLKYITFQFECVEMKTHYFVLLIYVNKTSLRLLIVIIY
jgi:hypothetical protein